MNPPSNPVPPTPDTDGLASNAETDAVEIGLLPKTSTTGPHQAPNTTGPHQSPNTTGPHQAPD